MSRLSNRAIASSIGLSAGVPIQQQMRDVSRGADIVVGTPGRIMDLQARGALDLSAVSTHSLTSLAHSPHSLASSLSHSESLTHSLNHSRVFPKFQACTALSSSLYELACHRHLRACCSVLT